MSDRLCQLTQYGLRMVGTTATSGPAAAAPSGVSRSTQVALLAVGACSGLLVTVTGWFLGAASLTAVEPDGLFVDCGPALVNRPDPLPHALCADAYFPLPIVSVAFLGSGALAVVLCSWLLVRGRTTDDPGGHRA